MSSGGYGDMPASDLDKMLFCRRSADLGLLTLVSPTTRIGANATAAATAIAIGFAFEFDGSGHIMFGVSPAGWVQFSGAAGSADNTELFAAAATEFVAPWWDAQKTAETTGYVKSELQGTAPFRRHVIEWLTYSSSADSPAANDLLRYQCVLYETTGMIEFRYATRTRTGTPTAATASRGVKGDTSGTATNYRDLAVDNLTLGGSKTTSTANLTVSAYDALVTGGAVVAEPNWPMCGRAFPVSHDDLTGLGLYDGTPDLLWKIANFVNWLWCLHTPPLINIAPYQQTGDSDVYLVVPCVPSVDGRPYTVYVEVYPSVSCNCTVYIDVDYLADPQPSAGGDWSNVTSSVQAVTGGSWQELSSFVATLPATAEYVRIWVSTPTPATVIVGSVLIVPKAATDVDETVTNPSGFVPMALGQLRASGAGVHAEWFNRAWAGIAQVLADRRQMLWSSVWTLDLGLTSSDEMPEHTIGASLCALPGWRGQAAVARIYASDNNYPAPEGAAPLSIVEEGNGLLTLFSVESTEFRRQVANVTLLSDEPMVRATVDPWGLTCPMTVVLDWAPNLNPSNLFVGLTPAPRLGLLFALVRRMELAFGATAYCGLATMLARGKTSSNKWRVQTWVGPAVKALRPQITRESGDQASESAWSLIYAASSGSAAADEIMVDSPFVRGRDDYPPDGAVGVGASAETYDATPIGTMSRLLESPTATSMTGGARERVDVVHGIGITFVPVPITGAALLAL